MNQYINICVFHQAYATPLKGSFDPQRCLDPQAENPWTNTEQFYNLTTAFFEKMSLNINRT